jgi:hypothetical protein
MICQPLSDKPFHILAISFLCRFQHLELMARQVTLNGLLHHTAEAGRLDGV